MSPNRTPGRYIPTTFGPNRAATSDLEENPWEIRTPDVRTLFRASRYVNSADLRILSGRGHGRLRLPTGSDVIQLEPTIKGLHVSSKLAVDADATKEKHLGTTDHPTFEYPETRIIGRTSSPTRRSAPAGSSVSDHLNRSSHCGGSGATYDYCSCRGCPAGVCHPTKPGPLTSCAPLHPKTSASLK